MDVLAKQIPDRHVMLLYWVRLPNDTRDTASSTGWTIVPAKGCITRAREIATYGDRNLHDNHNRGLVVGGRSVTILWPSGCRREVQPHDNPPLLRRAIF